MKVTFSRNMNGDALVLVDDKVVALAKECEGYDYLKAHILAFATPPKDAEVAMPQPCCGKYASCGRACVPRGRWEGQREGDVKECHVSALTQKIIQIRAGLTGLADPTERMDAMCATAADILLLLGDRT